MKLSRLHLSQRCFSIFCKENWKPHFRHIPKAWPRRKWYSYLTSLSSVLTCVRENKYLKSFWFSIPKSRMFFQLLEKKQTHCDVQLCFFFFYNVLYPDMPDLEDVKCISMNYLTCLSLQRLEKGWYQSTAVIRQEARRGMPRTGRKSTID